MKICFVTSKLNFETAGGSVADLDLRARAFQELNNEVKVITVFSKANRYSRLPYDVIEENIKSKRLLGIQWGVFRILRTYSKEADIFYIDGHSFLYGAGLYRLLGGRVPVAACFNRELVCWPENISSFFESGKRSANLLGSYKKKIRWCVEKYASTPIANNLDLVTFTNPYLKKAYWDFGLRVNANSSVVGDCFDYRKIMEEYGLSQNSYKERNKKNGIINLFYSSRMAPGKGFDLLITAFSKVKNKENFKLVLGGGGPEESLIRKMIKDLRMEPYVELPGWVPKEKVYDFYRMADIFIQAKWRNDMTSTSLLEAMAFGVPSILPGGGGLEWIAKKSALYFKDDDENDLAEKIEQLGADYRLRDQLSQNGHRRLAEDEINYRKQVAMLNEKLKQLSEK